jgi:hypothetical protein
MDIKAQALPTMLQVFREYFDAKYPCTDESNDGSKMPIEDKIKYAVYNYLLDIYNREDCNGCRRQIAQG